MEWGDKTVLVTGAGGFIGSHLVEALVERGARVTAFVRYNSRGEVGTLALLPRSISEKVSVISGDLADPVTAASIVEGQAVVFHLAALVGIPYSYVHPAEVVRVNSLATTFLLEGCLRKGVERVVCFSTSEVYGTARYAPIDEEHPLQAQSPYAASKVASDQISLSFHRAFGLPVSIARPFNAYGPRQSTRAVIPTIISQALLGGPVRLGSLTPTRDLCFVQDTVRGVIRMAEVDAALGEIVNLGTGVEVTIGDLAERIFALLGGSIQIVSDPQRVRPEKSEVMRLIADSAKAERLLGWVPSVGLDEGLSRTIDWVKQNKGFYSASSYHV